MSRRIDFTVINNHEALVLISWEIFRRLLNVVPKSILIKEFAIDFITKSELKKLSKNSIIDRIFIESETSFPE